MLHKHTGSVYTRWGNRSIPRWDSAGMLMVTACSKTFSESCGL